MKPDTSWERGSEYKGKGLKVHEVFMLDIRVVRGWTFGYNELKRAYDGSEGRGGTSLIISNNNQLFIFSSKLSLEIIVWCGDGWCRSEYACG